MKKIILFLAFTFVTTSTFSQKIVEITFQESLTKDELGGLLFGFAVKHGIEAYKVLYETLDTDGTIDTASGLFVVPLLEQRDELLPILAYQHGTASARDAVPSNIEVFERRLAYFFAGQGYYTTAADYLGLGESKRAAHPYLHAATEASAAIDLVSAVKTFMDTEGLPYNDQLFVTGYSQGGHAAMAMHKALETNPVEGLTVTAASPMSGIYNLSGEILAASFTDVPYFFPSYLVWMATSYQSVYGNIYNQPSDIFRANVLTEIKGFIEGVITRAELNALLINKLEKEFGVSVVKNLLTPEYLKDFQNNPENTFRIALKDNDLFNWVPQVPTRMMYCTADDQVVYTNSTFTDSVMNANGAMDVLAVDVNTTADHGQCVFPAVISTILFFEELAVRELILSTKDIDSELAFSINPNPANNYIQLNFNDFGNVFTDYQLKLVHLNGQVVKKLYTNNLQNFTISLNDVPSGLYIMHVQSKNGFWTEKVMVSN